MTVRSVYGFHSHDMLVAGEVGTVVGDGGTEAVYVAALEIRTDRIRGMLPDDELLHGWFPGWPLGPGVPTLKMPVGNRVSTSKLGRR